MQATSRFAGISSNGAKWVLGLLLMLMLASLGPAFNKATPGIEAKPAIASEPKTAKSSNPPADIDLYRNIVERMQAGENYYAAAAVEQRTHGYPLKPFVTVRLPTLALIVASLGIGFARILEIAIGLAVLYAWHQKLADQKVIAWRRWTQVVFLAASLSSIFAHGAVFVHEVWAGALIALSLALHRPHKWLASLMIAACALAIRELALPYVLLMAAFALVQRRWVETAAWSALILLFSAFMYAHFQAVSGVVLPTDLQSPSWLLHGGPAAALSFIWQSLPVSELPAFVAFPMILVGLFGWLCWRSEVGLFGFLLILGYMLAFAITGRPNNFYWGFLVSPLLLMGLIFVGPGLRDLQAAIQSGGPKSRLA